MAEGRSCCSAYRCSSIECASCGWRYSLSVARRILHYEPRSLHSTTITCAASSPAEFRRWRRAVHNAATYQRRHSRWWRSVGLWGWWSGVGLHGLVELGTITATEFISALQRQGAILLRPIAIETIRTEVYRAARSASRRSDAAGRYQPVKIAIEPVSRAVSTVPIVDKTEIEALPVIV